MKLTKKEIDAIQKLGWHIEKTPDGYFLENYSPADGDMIIEAEDKEGIIDYCNNYDPNEEFNCWYNAKRGEPSTPGDLWEDCLEKGKMLNELAKILE